MSAKLYSCKVITSQQSREIDDLIGEAQMKEVLDIVIDSLVANQTAKYKGFLIAMEENEDTLLQMKAAELGKWISS